ncbi:hypothetical protein DIPPA_16604 [Diplonema papillatum]|nr:hypothetical protein DIPPA_16604 [Diplonema papillatum]|eukprot:gene1748-2653_t
MLSRGLVRRCVRACTTATVQTRMLPDGGKATGTFDGNGKIHEGTILAADGSKRTGVFSEGSLVEGRVSLPDGRVFTGRFRDGKIDASFDAKLEEDGAVYTGRFNAAWQRHGTGTEVLPDGASHSGVFEDDYLSEGTVSMPETATRGAIHFEGKLRNGRFANGVLKFNGMTYTGELLGNNPHGKGRLLLPDGSVQEGTFAEGVLHGKAKIILKNGTVLSGKFEQGALPTGEAKWPNGDFYEGDLDEQHRPDGDGVMFKAQKQHWWTGQWKAGSFSGGSVVDDEGSPVDYRQSTP